MGAWKIHEARTNFSQVLNQADTEGPQTITHHGKERAVVLSMNAYRSIKPAEKLDFISYLLTIPKVDWDEDEMERDHAVSDREIDL